MIIRKPYAFLIKHFRLIHGLLFVMLVFMAVKSTSIYTFFNEYATRHYFTNTGSLSSEYVSTFMFIVLMLIALLSAVIYYLLSVKKKNRGIYLIIVIYSFILFAYFIYISSVLGGLMEKALKVETVRAIRDISIMAVIPQIIFSFIILLRSLGFNLKKFEFKKDLEDLQIETTDNEEVEVTLGKNNYKYKRFIVKSMRYLGYFIQENKFFVTAVLSALMLGISITIYLNIKVYNVKYMTNQLIYANTMWYKVNNAYITDMNINGIVIDNEKDYIVVNVTIDNRSNTKYDLSRELFRLDTGKQSILPKFNLDKEFVDFGKIYSPMSIDAGNIEEVNVVFEVDKNKDKVEYLFKISNIENINANSVKEQYKDVIINPINIDESIESSSYHMFEDISFTETILKDTKLKIKGYETSKSFKDSYQYCYKNNCYDKSYVVKPSDSDKNVIIKITAEYEVDSESSMKKQLSNVENLFEYFAKIKYRYLGVSYEMPAKKVNVDYLKSNIAYLEVPREIIDANKIEIILSIRGKKITIVLK